MRSLPGRGARLQGTLFVGASAQAGISGHVFGTVNFFFSLSFLLSLKLKNKNLISFSLRSLVSKKPMILNRKKIEYLFLSFSGGQNDKKKKVHRTKHVP